MSDEVNEFIDWLLEGPDFDVIDLSNLAKEAVRFLNLSKNDDSTREFQASLRYMVGKLQEEAVCDHSAGICYCALLDELDKLEGQEEVKKPPFDPGQCNCAALGEHAPCSYCVSGDYDPDTV